jgi:SOS response regulatory protein OraA/RecX
MGAGNKVDTTAFEVADIYDTSVCPLAKVMRYELRRRGIEEEAAPPVEDAERLAELLQTKYAARLGDERGRHTVYQALLRKGFSYVDVRSAMKEYIEEG